MYKELQTQVFEWLTNKNQQDHSFTFSVRQKANKGAELNYFIGTERSNYFSTTFWFIPVSFPGSSGDLMNLVISIKKNKKIEFHFQCNQTKEPHDQQNQWALELVQNIRKKIDGNFEHTYLSPESNKMEFAGIYSTAKYDSFDELKDDLNELLNKIIPIVDEEIRLLKIQNPEFIAHRFSRDEQQKMLQKMQERLEKYKIVEQLEEELEEEEFDPFIEFEESIAINQILYGPPGTGKTYNTINKAIEIANPSFNLNQKREIIKAEFERLVKEKQIMFTTFHQSMTYEDFIEGIKPLKPEADDEFVKYDIQNGIFKTICEKATQIEVSEDNFEKAFQELISEIEKAPSKNLILETLVHSKEFTIYKNSKGNLKFHTNTEKAYEGVIRKDIIEHYLKTGEALDWPSYTKAVAQYLVEKFNYNKILKPIEQKNYVLIIDEINRGNVSQIFGELITLIEEDKRLGNDEALEVTLPYSKEKFGVPSNLYIIGTMNTADRSVEALDTALRRRFVFEEMLPKYDLEGLKQELYGFKAFEILETINKRIEKLLDRDHQIGHAYFINKDEITIIDSFYKNIIPLLQEYFFGDYGKMGLVLGSGFIKLVEQDSVFANFEHLDFAQFEERESYEIIDHKNDPLAFEEAIRLLMNKK